VIEPRRGTVLLEEFPQDARGTPLLHKQRSVVLTDDYQDEPSRLAKVVAVGRGVLDVKTGWTVLCNRYPASAWSFEHEGRELVSVKQDEILARIEVVNGKK